MTKSFQSIWRVTVATTLCSLLLWPRPGLTQTDPAPPSPGILASEFIYETAPFPQCHASTIESTKDGLVCAWFGGTRERDPDVGIWFSRRENDKWTAPVELANGIQDDKKRHPCWNPVLFQMPPVVGRSPDRSTPVVERSPANVVERSPDRSTPGPLLLFYKVGPSPSTWWGMLIKSDDTGRTWSKPEKLPNDIAGPIKNKPILLADGRLLSGSSTEDKGWRVHMEWTTDAGKTWDRTQPLCDGVDQGAIQPTIFRHGTKLQMLCRNRMSGPLWQSWSEDAGRTWTKFELTDLPHPGSGIDGVTLADGRHLLVYNHTLRGRSPLNVALSTDGKKWSAAAILESQPGEYSYPAVIQTPDNLVHITYTWKRQRVRHVTVDPAKLVLKPIENGQWPQ